MTEQSGPQAIVLPNEKLSWMLDQPDNVLSVGEAHYEQLAGKYSFTDPLVLKELYHEHVVHKYLARRVHTTIPRVWAGIQTTIDQLWGTDTDKWQEFKVMNVLTKVVASVSNHFLVSLPLAANEDFLISGRAFADDVILCGLVNGLLAEPLKPLIMPIVALRNRYHLWRVSRHALPVIGQRLADVEESEKKSEAEVELPDDYITWHIKYAKSERNTRKLKPLEIVKSLMGIEFAANHTTLLVFTNVLLDLLGSDPKLGYLSSIREEIEHVYAESGQVWTKASLAKLYRTDSAIRESMRMNSVLYAVTRKVIAPEGVRNEEEGWTAPYGSHISVAVDARHFDPEVYPDPHTYDAFRFSREMGAYEAGDKSSKEYLKLKSKSIVSTSQDFLLFGHGRHACPGRFFIEGELKMLLAYMLMNYDLQHFSKGRPKNFVFGGVNAPPAGATMKVRRKKEATVS